LMLGFCVASEIILEVLPFMRFGRSRRALTSWVRVGRGRLMISWSVRGESPVKRKYGERGEEEEKKKVTRA
jgi:hypothetical protein